MAEYPKSSYSLYAEVVFPLPLDQSFTYGVPEALKDQVAPGFRVLAPFGQRRLTGFVVALRETTDRAELKEIEDVLDPEPVFSEEMLALTRWMSDYYLTPWGEVLNAALPGGIQLESRRLVRLRAGVEVSALLESDQNLTDRQRQILEILSQAGELRVDQLRRRLGVQNLHYSLSRLQEAGLVETRMDLLKPRVRVRKEKFVTLHPNWRDEARLGEEIQRLMRIHSRQAEVLKLLQRRGEGMSQKELLAEAGVSASTVTRLHKRGVVEVSLREVVRDYYAGIPVEPLEPITLNPDQERALEAIRQKIHRREHEVFLLHGVTGSGKTQIYIEAIKEARAHGRTAIVLVPEIALTPQIVNRFRFYFGGEVTVWHSRMSMGERYDAWRKIREGRFSIVIGPRSAVFAPLQNLGLLVVDEEQEATYRQSDQSPRYHAREVAITRGQLDHAVVILGSATPSVESYHRAQVGQFSLLHLPRRIDNLPLPRVEIINMVEEWKKQRKRRPPVFSERLLEKIAEKLIVREQVILLQNRRGFSTCLICRECGHTERCPNCHVTFTYHLRGHTLVCHYCDYRKKAPGTCPNCGGTNIKYGGVGTQRVEEELKFHFPMAQVVRMDFDTTSRKGAHDRILRDFAQGRYDILLGTQMVAKGLDFPRVTLVGVISADTSLLIPDFRASERTFQLLTQVAGRSGRKEHQGEVIIQTYCPLNHSIQFAKRHDFLGFYRKEIQERAALLYPPFGRLIEVEFRGGDKGKVQEAADRFAAYLDVSSPFYQVLGPSPAPLSRIRGEYRYQIILKGDATADPSGQRLREEVRSAYTRFHSEGRCSGVKVTIDVDPLELL